MKKGICMKGHIFTEKNSYLRKDGRRTCKICSDIRHKERQANPEKYKRDLLQQKIHYKENKERLLKENKERWWKNKAKYNQQQRDSYPEKLRLLKKEVMTYYGGGKQSCVCCGENLLGFLTIDHINGRKEYEKGKTRYKYVGKALWAYLKRNGFPEGYQTLCWNCNSGRQINNGVCPHQIIKSTIEIKQD